MGKKILVVDDELNILEVLKESLLTREHEVDTANNVDDGFDMILRSSYDIVITDIAMPGKNGFDLVKSIRDKPELKDLPIIMLTGLKTKEMVSKGLQLGVNAYLAKPIKLEKLFDSIDSLTKHKTEKSSVSGVDLSNVHVLVVDDEPGIVEVLHSMLDLIVGRITTANSVDKAIAFLKNSRYDLVLSDVSMPDKTGFDLIEWINQDPGSIGMPVVLMTGVIRDANSIMRAQQLLIDKYLIKPVDMNNLRKTVEIVSNAKYKKIKLEKFSKHIEELEEVNKINASNHLERLRKNIRNVKNNIKNADKTLKILMNDQSSKAYFDTIEKRKSLEAEVSATQEALNNSKKEFHEKGKYLLSVKRSLFKKMELLSM